MEDSKVINERKYNKIVAKLKSQFPNLDFSEIAINYELAPSLHKATHKQLVRCPVHGWFNIHLYSMLYSVHGCTRCGNESKALAFKCKTKARKPVKLSSVGVQRLSWTVPKSVITTSRYSSE